MENKGKLTIEDFKTITTNEELVAVIKKKKVPFSKVEKLMLYEEELRNLQIELVKLQQWIAKNNKRKLSIFNTNNLLDFITC